MGLESMIPAADNEPMPNRSVNAALENPYKGNPGEMNGYSRIDHQAKSEAMIRAAEREHSNNGINHHTMNNTESMRETRLGKPEMNKRS